MVTNVHVVRRQKASNRVDCFHVYFRASVTFEKYMKLKTSICLHTVKKHYVTIYECSCCITVTPPTIKQKLGGFKVVPKRYITTNRHEEKSGQKPSRGISKNFKYQQQMAGGANSGRWKNFIYEIFHDEKVISFTLLKCCM